MHKIPLICACAIYLASIATAAPETVELRHITAAEAMRECLVSLLHSQGERGPVPASLAIEQVRVGETLLKAEPRSNQFTFDAPQGDADLLRAVLKEIDVQRASILIQAVVVEVSGLEYAGDLIGRRRSDSALIVDPDQESFAELVDRLGRDERCKILAKPRIHVRENTESVISQGDNRGKISLKIRALGRSDGTISLDVSSSRVIGESRSELGTHVSLSDGGTFVLAGYVEGEKELLVLISPSLQAVAPEADD
jgi:type II secretory pathway component GspD/PulD (secretin)